MSNKMMTLDDFHDVHLNVKKDELILDVRNPDEFASGYVKGAVNYPLPELLNHVEELKKYSQVYIYCKRGGRAQTALRALEAHGLQNVVCIYDAGTDLWRQSGYALET